MSDNNLSKPNFGVDDIDETNYPGVKITIDDNTAVVAEQCIGDDTNRKMIRVYSKENDEPISINWITGEITIPREWSGCILKE